MKTADREIVKVDVPVKKRLSQITKEAAGQDNRWKLI
jgi:hypothetical protein